MLDAIHHCAIICSNYQVTKHFYTQILGLTVIAEHYRAERDSYKLDLALPDGSQIELFSFAHPPTRSTSPEACGLRHLAFSVCDLDQVIAYLQRHDISCESVRVDPYTQKRFTFFKDPDDLPLELYEVRSAQPLQSRLFKESSAINHSV
ncbi:SMU1112c/YaeR family gloxylase I-like metalloprotein [Celerinatantimonas yamalensis]|uniref:VOC family protein n=1 Tax=Celerinatantimonas yamalensis TaxID=559956 RepID=A0ABW9G758_9GAMM